MREQGELVKKGSLSDDGDVEFWANGSTKRRNDGVREEGNSTGGSDVVEKGE